MALSLTREILEEVEQLDMERQRRVLGFARSLNRDRQGTPGNTLLQFMGAIPTEDLQQMADAIEQGCEGVNPNEW